MVFNQKHEELNNQTGGGVGDKRPILKINKFSTFFSNKPTFSLKPCISYF